MLYASLPPTPGRWRWPDPFRVHIDAHSHTFRATETELDQLFQWASPGHERTVNQRIRPGLLIVVNMDAPSLDEQWLDVDYATDRFLQNLELSDNFEELKEEWRLRGRVISTARDLILCYYDSFRIICIPSHAAPDTTHGIAIQYSRLYTEIEDISKQLRRKKMQVHMNLNVPKFCNYIEHVSSRLARDLKSCVDFHYLASRNSSQPTKFRHHMVALMNKLKEDEENVDPPCDVQEGALINRVIPFVACCIAFQVYNNASSPGKLGAPRLSVLSYLKCGLILLSRGAGCEDPVVSSRVSSSTRNI